MKSKIERIRKEMARALVGQQGLVDGLLIALLCHQHVLVEGVPGLAKTTAVRAFSRVLGLSFRRIQFTPDLLPADLLGTHVYEPQRGEFRLHRGPIFHHLILADEINRAPAKVQSALLEAMEERQVTLAGETLALPKPFLLMATQNPIEQEGVYPLPEAQVDRFMLKLRVDYPSHEEEVQIVHHRTAPEDPKLPMQVLDASEIDALRSSVRRVHVEPTLVEYSVCLVEASRKPESVQLGGSPRASIYLIEAARARAFIELRDYVLPQDIKRVAPDVLRHRLRLTYEAEAQGLTPDQVIDDLLGRVPTP
ncbi:MAG: MoxR family ATPase [Deltaproteobacteria bacterium]|nr:MoxR family ATPase [Deltaproteobacteria bacterium]